MTRVSSEEMRVGVIRILANLAEVAPEKIRSSDRLCEDLGFDSLKRMEALGSVADDFEIDPDLEKTMAVQTVGDVLEIVESYVSDSGSEQVAEANEFCACSAKASGSCAR